MLWIDPKPRARAQDRNHIVLLQVTVTAFCTKFGSAWSSIIFQPLHDLNCHSWFWRSFLAKNISLFYKDISGPHIILHDASVLALWPVPEGAAPVLSRSFEYQQRRSSSWGLKEGIDHLWWIGTCAVQEKWLVNGWKMWELVLSSKSLLLSPLWHKGPRAPVVWEMQNGRGERERERERQWLWDPVGVDGTFSWDSLGVPAFFYFPAWPDWPSMSSGFAAVLQPWMVHREHERHGWVPEAPVCTGIILEFHCFGVRKRRCCVPLSHAALPACRNYCKWWFIKSL